MLEGKAEKSSKTRFYFFSYMLLRKPNHGSIRVAFVIEEKRVPVVSQMQNINAQNIYCNGVELSINIQKQVKCGFPVQTLGHDILFLFCSVYSCLACTPTEPPKQRKMP